MLKISIDLDLPDGTRKKEEKKWKRTNLKHTIDGESGKEQGKEEAEEEEVKESIRQHGHCQVGRHSEETVSKRIADITNNYYKKYYLK